MAAVPKDIRSAPLELAEVTPAVVGVTPDNALKGVVDVALPPPDFEIILVIPGKHGGNIPFIFSVPSTANGEEFMIQLHIFLLTVVFLSPHVRYHDWITRFLFRDTIGLGTVSSLQAPPFLEAGEVWPVDLLLSQTEHSRDFTAGYYKPACLRHSQRFPQHPAFRRENNDCCVIVMGRTVNHTSVAAGVALYIAVGFGTYFAIGGLANRWDIAAGVGTGLFATLSILQGLALKLLKR